MLLECIEGENFSKWQKYLFKFLKVNKQLQRWCQAATRAAAAAGGCLAGRLVDRLAGPVPKKIT